jgi:signal transduction histidine kinase
MPVDPAYCGWDTTSTLLIFSDNVFGNFIYYSHLLPIVCLLFLAGTLLWQNPRDNAVRALLVAALSFTAWSLSDLILWATANPIHTMFFWSNIIHFELLIYISLLYFIYYFVTHRSPSWKQELAILIAYIPIILFAHTSFNLAGYDYTNCNREALEGSLLTYVYIFELAIALWILIFGFNEYRKAGVRRYEIILATFGAVFCLVSFSLGNIIGTLEVDWELGQYGLFSLPIFVGLLTYLIIRYRSMNVKLFSAQALVGGIVILITSLLFIRQIENVRVVTLITAVLAAVLGFVLIRSVKREIEQRTQIEQLANRLQNANKRLKILDQMKSEFVSIASHQLRSPLTSIRGYASMLLEGSFGKLPQKAEEAVSRIAESSRFMALSVEDYLNVSRIQSGNMKYVLSEFSVKDVAKGIADDMRPEGVKRGLLITFTGDTQCSCVVKADIGKTRQIIQNLVDNALKYTKKGSIEIKVYDKKNPKRVYVDVTDTGIGMSQETLESIFGKFERARNANEVNVTGTGLGLYVAKKMAEDMGGTISATSPGENQGSTFTLSLPYVR